MLSSPSESIELGLFGFVSLVRLEQKLSNAAESTRY